ncbi:hypothetical protein PHLCEN_2v333 [Hermanssonia centrifuga]|uniref:Uncharacterized protein n=1 Tax=Hermanssonia centrifuga TaxID=98765 RepID=A0A2R6S6I0_9APHY|nr:hypothetical protein PHLCEN_2v333 [Hermanssonia centrifuga]
MSSTSEDDGGFVVIEQISKHFPPAVHQPIAEFIIDQEDDAQTSTNAVVENGSEPEASNIQALSLMSSFCPAPKVPSVRVKNPRPFPNQRRMVGWVPGSRSERAQVFTQTVRGNCLRAKQGWFSLSVSLQVKYRREVSRLGLVMSVSSVLHSESDIISQHYLVIVS